VDAPGDALVEHAEAEEATAPPELPLDLGSYEDWALTMGGILDACGVTGFLSNLERFYERADTEGHSWRVFVGEWWERHGSQPVTVKQAADSLWDSDGQGPLELRGDTEKARLTSLGTLLSKHEGRVFDRWCVERNGRPRRAVQWWRLVPAKEVPGGGEPGHEVSRSLPSTRCAGR
jgi:putative DNA primase/helicase